MEEGSLSSSASQGVLPVTAGSGYCQRKGRLDLLNCLKSFFSDPQPALLLCAFRPQDTYRVLWRQQEEPDGNSTADGGKPIPAAAALYKLKVVKFSACFVWRDLEISLQQRWRPPGIGCTYPLVCCLVFCNVTPGMSVIVFCDAFMEPLVLCKLGICLLVCEYISNWDNGNVPPGAESKL